MKLGNFEIESLQSRRDASIASLAFKLLDGKGRGELNHFTRVLTVNRFSGRPVRSCSNPFARVQPGIRLVDLVDAGSLDQYKRSMVGAAPRIWDSLPQELLTERLDGGWCKITKRAKNVLVGKTDPDAVSNPRYTTPASSPVKMHVLVFHGPPVETKIKFFRLKSTPNLWDQLSHYTLSNRPRKSK